MPALEVTKPPANKNLIIGIVALILIIIALAFGLIQGGNSKQQALAALQTSLDEKEKELQAALDQKADLEARLARWETKSADLEKQLQDKDQALKEKEAATRDLEEKLKAQLSSEPSATVERSEDGGLKIQLADTVFFPSASADLKPSGQDLLGPLAESLKTSSAHRIFIVGHTDNWPIHKNIKKYFSNNRDLSAARAVAAVEYLTSQGIPSAKLAAIGMGESKPIADNDTEEGRSKNRRIEIYLLDSDKLPF